MHVLVVNAGSSSLKLSVINDDGDTVVVEQFGAPSDPATTAALERFLASLARVGAVGHRIVHGGPDVVAPTVITAEVRRQLELGAEIAPLHVPAALAILDIVQAALAVPGVVCVDTAFHTTMPVSASTYAIPSAWRTDFGIRRFGFHGLSYAWALQRAATLLSRDSNTLQLVVAHLGSGASVCAMRDGGSADTSMGFTPLEGLVMGTRSGSVDPGALTWLQTQHGVTAAQVADGLEHQSGLRGLCGTGDVRELLARANSGDRDAILARDVFVHRAAAGIASMAASLDRLDAVVFTGGIGEHSADMRQRICDRLHVVGVAAGTLDEAPGNDFDLVVSAPDAAVAVLVVHAREDLQIAAEVRRLIAD